MASSIGAKSYSLLDASEVAGLDTETAHHSSVNEGPSSGAVGLIRGRTNARGALMVVGLFCLALFVAGIHLGRRGIRRMQSRESVHLPSRRFQLEVPDRVAKETEGSSEGVSDAVAVEGISTGLMIKEYEDRIAALKEAVQNTKERLREKGELLLLLQGKLDRALEIPERLQDTNRELDILETKVGSADALRREADQLVKAVQLAKAGVNARGTQDIAKVLEEQREILLREKALAAQGEKNVSRDLEDAAHESEASKIKKAVVSVEEAIDEIRLKLEVMVSLKTQIKRLSANLEGLQTRRKHLPATIEKLGRAASERDGDSDQAGLGQNQDLKDVLKNRGMLADRMRRFQARNLAERIYELHGATRQMKEHIILFRSRLPEGGQRLDIFSEDGSNIFQTLKRSLQGEVTVEYPGAVEYSAEHIQLGISKRLNDKLLECESKHAQLVSQMEEQQYIRSLDETDEEEERLQPIKEELRTALKKVSQFQKVQGRLTTLEEIARDFVRQMKPKENPSYFYVDAFRSVDTSDGDGKSTILFEYVGVFGGDSSGIVLNVRPVDAELRGKLGSLLMKIFTAPKASTEEELHYSLLKVWSALDLEKFALQKIALKGETVQHLARRAGVTGAHYSGNVNGWDSDFLVSHGKIAVGQVLFSPPVTADLVALYLGSDEPIPMQARIYLAQRFLMSIAHIHKSGFVYNNLTLGSAGITEDGRLSLMKWNCFEKPGAMRKVFSAINISPEAALEFFKNGSAPGDYSTESWAVGVMLYRIFSHGILPFSDTDESFFDKLVQEGTVERTSKMTNIESPAPQLRRFGVPDLWVTTISLLLERNAGIRPSVLQVLAAYPQLGSGPLQALEEGHAMV